ncbi:MAG: L,D-transpeptidase, partial [Pseudolabrys sp.]
MSTIKSFGTLTVLAAAAALACGGAQAEPLAYAAPAPQRLTVPPPAAAATPRSAEYADNDAQVPDENARLPARFRTRMVDFQSSEPPGTIIVDTPHTYLYFILGHGKAIRYGIGVGREGFAWSGVKHIAHKREWPDWYPPPEMIKRQPYLPRMMAGGPGNPLGSRALYIGGTEYRIHGTNDPTSIGKDVSSGCIHLTNDNAIDLYNR